MKTIINVHLGRDHVYNCNTNFIGRSGENESTQFQIEFEDCLCDSWVYIDFVKPDGTKYKTPKLDIVDNVVIYDVTNELLTDKGMLKAQIVLQNEEGIVWKSTVKTYEIIQSIDATDDIPNKEDFITEAQTLLNEIEEGLTPTIGENGNWYVGDKDTGKPSQGLKGDSYIITDEDLQEVEEQVKTDVQPYLEEMKDIAETAESIAKGANQALSFGDYTTMISVFNKLDNDTYRVGQNILIVTLNVPDLWISEVSEESTPYTYTNDEDFADTLKLQGHIQAGYYKLSALETQKVDLTDYVKNTDYVTNAKAGIVRTLSGYGVIVINPATGLIGIQPAAENDIDEKTNNYKPIVPSKLDYAVKSVVGGHVTLTQAEYDALETKDENTYYYIVEE